MSSANSTKNLLYSLEGGELSFFHNYVHLKKE